MKPRLLILILVLFIYSGKSYSQNVYNMNSGETVTVDENGHILQSGKTTISKIAMPVNETVVQKEVSMYHENGRLRIPGYVPSDNQVADEENYKTAKLMLMQKNPQEFEKWFGSKPTTNRIIVRAEEFAKMPDIKKQQILANPAKYYIEDVNINPDCNHQ